MTRCINKRYLLIVVLDLIGGNVLSNTTSLTINNIGFANGIQQGSFAVVYMTQNTYYWRTFLHGLGNDLFLGFLLLFLSLSGVNLLPPMTNL